MSEDLFSLRWLIYVQSWSCIDCIPQALHKRFSGMLFYTNIAIPPYCKRHFTNAFCQAKIVITSSERQRLCFHPFLPVGSIPGNIRKNRFSWNFQNRSDMEYGTFWQTSSVDCFINGWMVTFLTLAVAKVCAIAVLLYYFHSIFVTLFLRFYFTHLSHGDIPISIVVM